MNIVALASDIADLVITDLTIYGLDDYPDQVNTRAKHVLMLDPITPVEGAVMAVKTLGTLSSRLRTWHYTMNYVLLYEQAGTGRGLSDIYEGMAAMANTIIETIATHDWISGGCVKAVTPSIKAFTRVFDPANTEFYAVTFAFAVMEYVKGAA